MKSSAMINKFEQYGDEYGHLVVVENEKDIPFETKRIFYIYGSNSDVVRGQHANRKTQFLLINVIGTSKVRVKMCGGGGESFLFRSSVYGFIFASYGMERNV